MFSWESFVLLSFIIFILDFINSNSCLFTISFIYFGFLPRKFFLIILTIRRLFYLVFSLFYVYCFSTYFLPEVSVILLLPHRIFVKIRVCRMLNLLFLFKVKVILYLVKYHSLSAWWCWVGSSLSIWIIGIYLSSLT